MQWVSTDGKRLDLRIAGYQYPAMTGSGAAEQECDDANWLIIAGHVLAGFGDSWSFAEPCMTVFEARRLGDWLNRAADGRRPEPLGFMEPCLTFAIPPDEGAMTVMMRFSHEAAPSRRFDEPVEVLFPMDVDELRQAAMDWVGEAGRLPPR
jgi:hypothetical protein